MVRNMIKGKFTRKNYWFFLTLNADSLRTSNARKTNKPNLKSNHYSLSFEDIVKF